MWQKVTYFLPPDTRTYQEVRNVRFSESLACFVFLKLPFRDSPFRVITDNICNGPGYPDIK